MAANDRVPHNFSTLLQKFLSKQTGRLWNVRVVDSDGEVRTLHERDWKRRTAISKLLTVFRLPKHSLPLGSNVVIMKEPDAWTGYDRSAQRYDGEAQALQAQMMGVEEAQNSGIRGESGGGLVKVSSRARA